MHTTVDMNVAKHFDYQHFMSIAIFDTIITFQHKHLAHILSIAILFHILAYTHYVLATAGLSVHVLAPRPVGRIFFTSPDLLIESERV